MIALHVLLLFLQICETSFCFLAVVVCAEALYVCVRSGGDKILLSIMNSAPGILKSGFLLDPSRLGGNCKCPIMCI